MEKLVHKQAKDEHPFFPGFLKDGQQGLRVLFSSWARLGLLPRILTVGTKEHSSGFGFVISNSENMSKSFQLPCVRVSSLYKGNDSYFL